MSNSLTFNGRPLLFNGPLVFGGTTPPEPQDEVQIGNQIWKSKNLAIDDGQGGIYTRTVNYGQGDVTEYYYTWDAAVRVAASISGWHLPTWDDYSTLISTIGGRFTGGPKLKSTYGWNDDGNGTDDYGFAVFPAGTNNSGSGSWARFWTSTQTTETVATTLWMWSTTIMISSSNEAKTNVYPIRLVKDAT